MVRKISRDPVCRDSSLYVKVQKKYCSQSVRKFNFQKIKSGTRLKDSGVVSVGIDALLLSQA